MKYKSHLLDGLFVICMFLCVTVFGSMLFGMVHAAPAHRVPATQATVALVPMPCPLLPDGVLCVREG